MTRSSRIAAALGMLLVGAATALGQSQDEIEKQALKEKLDYLMEKTKSLPEPGAKDPGIVPYFKDGFRFRSTDGALDGYIGGRFLQHFRWVQDRPEGSRTSADTFFVRQARLETGGTFYTDYEYKVQADFPTGTSSTSGTLQDGYLGYKHYPGFSLRAGQFKEPFSQEETTTTRFIDFCERSNLNRLVPARDIGIAAYGTLSEGLFEYEAGIFNGNGRALLDANDEKDIAARLRVNPFLTQEGHLLQGLRLGLAATAGSVDRGSIDGLDFTTTELAAKFMDAGGATNVIDGERTRLGFEAAWVNKGTTVRTEYVTRTDTVDTATMTDEEIDLSAWYFAVTHILTGEKKQMEKRITPNDAFNPEEEKKGAVELAFRVARLEVDSSIFDLGIASATTNSDAVTSFTLGLNWYMTKNFRISPNYVIENYDDEVNFGTRTEDSLSGFLLRIQIDF